MAKKERTAKRSAAIMNVVIIIGKTGTGKSEVVKEMIPGKACFIFDINNEYGERTKYPGQKKLNLSSDTHVERSRHIEGDFDLFVEQVKTKEKTIVVFEDATGFIAGVTPKVLKRLLTNKLFTGNMYILLFHFIDSVPPQIMGLADYVVLFATNDERYRIEKKYPRLVPYFDKLQTKPIGTNFKIKMT